MNVRPEDLGSGQAHNISKGWFVLKRFAIFSVLMICVALFIIAFGQTFASTQLYEVGDFAANSVLVQEAKRFHLLVGNYSRIGFNHPGPAFLYVLAAGEVVFFDLGRLVASPFSGQIFSVALLSAFWIVSIGTLLHRLQGTLPSAVATTALFVAVSAYINYQAFLGTWLPHLYYFAFATFTVAVAALIMGRRDGLMMLAVSWGFLVNGHVSFVGITIVMLVCAFAANTCLYVNSSIPREKWLLSSGYLGRNFRAVASALVIAALFLFPLGLRTILRFPGPVADYFAFAGAHHANHFGDAVRFVGVFWSNGLFAILFSATTCALLVTGNPVRDSEERIGPERAIALSLASATAAFLFYAIFGVDNLSFTYVGIFYYAVPALALALILKRLLDNLAITPVRATMGVCVAAGMFTAIRIHEPPEYVSQYNDPAIPSLYQAIEKLGAGRVVLDLDSQGNWENLWTTLVGAEAYAKRQGIVPFCIAQNWQIVFSEAARCAKTDLDHASGRYLVSTELEPGAFSAMTVAGLYFYPRALGKK